VASFMNFRSPTIARRPGNRPKGIPAIGVDVTRIVWADLLWGEPR
jgi:hypothetical protein